MFVMLRPRGASTLTFSWLGGVLREDKRKKDFVAKGNRSIYSARWGSAEKKEKKLFAVMSLTCMR